MTCKRKHMALADQIILEMKRWPNVSTPLGERTHLLLHEIFLLNRKSLVFNFL